MAQTANTTARTPQEKSYPATVSSLFAEIPPLLDSRGKKNYMFWQNLLAILGIMLLTVTFLFPARGYPCLCRVSLNRCHFTLSSTHPASKKRCTSTVSLHFTTTTTSLTPCQLKLSLLFTSEIGICDCSKFVESCSSLDKCCCESTTWTLMTC